MNGDMHVELVGSKLPMIAILGGLLSLAISIFYSAVWVTKLDDRVLQNAIHIAENRGMLVQHSKVMSELQRNLTKQTIILDSMVNRLDENK